MRETTVILRRTPESPPVEEGALLRVTKVIEVDTADADLRPPSSEHLTLVHGGIAADWLDSAEERMAGLTRQVNELKNQIQSNRVFVAQVMHDILNKLHALELVLHCWHRRPPTTSPEKEDRETKRPLLILENAVRLCQDLLSVAQGECGKFETRERAVDLRSEIALMVEPHFDSARQKDLLCRLNISEDVPEWVVLDPQRLDQILSNLLDNAVKYTEQGGIELCVDWQGDKLTVSVRDTGPGLGADTLRHLYSPFQRTKEPRQQGGFGLGLSIAHKLTAQMGGALKYSPPCDGETGSTFVLTLDVNAAGEEDIRSQPV